MSGFVYSFLQWVPHQFQQVYSRYFTLEGGEKSADHEAMYNACLVLKIVTKSCHRCDCKITLYSDELT